MEMHEGQNRSENMNNRKLYQENRKLRRKTVFINLIRVGLTFLILIGFFICIFIRHDIIGRIYCGVLLLLFEMLIVIALDVSIHKSVYDNCMFKWHTIYLQSQISCSITKRMEAKYRGELFSNYIALGEIEKSYTELCKLQNIYNKMSEEQKLLFIVYKLNYFRNSNQKKEFKNSLMEAEKIFDPKNTENPFDLMKINKKVKIMVENSIIINKLYYLGEWEKCIAKLHTIPCRTRFDQVNNAIWYGNCYIEMGLYENAAVNLNIAKKYGGDSKYVKLATEMLQKIGEEDIGETSEPNHVDSDVKQPVSRLNPWKYLLMAAVVMILFLYSNFSHPYCYNMESAYIRTFHMGYNQKVDILETIRVNDYNLAIIHCDDKVSYCLFHVKGEGNDARYQVKDGIVSELYITLPDYYTNTDTSDTEDTYYAADTKRARDEVIQILLRFYKRNKVNSVMDGMCIGVSSKQQVQNVLIDNNEIQIIKAFENNGNYYYIWEANHIDYDTILKNVDTYVGIAEE